MFCTGSGLINNLFIYIYYLTLPTHAPSEPLQTKESIHVVHDVVEEHAIQLRGHSETNKIAIIQLD